jgi:hypothetical protein
LAWHRRHDNDWNVRRNIMPRYIEKEEAKEARTTKSEIVNRVLEELHEEHGHVTPDMLVEVARPEDHPLHDQFEWNDTIAAEKYRREQARQMILASKFVCVLKQTRHRPPRVVKSQPVRKFLPSLEGGFKMRNEVLDSKDNRKLFVERRLAALQSWCKSVVDVEELAPLRESIEEQLPTYS